MCIKHLIWKLFCLVQSTWIISPVHTVGVIKNGTLVFVNFWAQGASIYNICCAHHEEQILRIPKHPHFAAFDWFEAKLQQFKENRCFSKIGVLFNIEKHFCGSYFMAIFLTQTHQKVDIWGCFGILTISSWWWAQEFWKCRSGSENWSLSCTFNTEIIFLSLSKWGLPASTSNFSASIFKISLCAHHQEEILIIPKHHPQKINFLMSIGQAISKKQRGSQNWIRPQIRETFLFCRLP